MPDMKKLKRESAQELADRLSRASETKGKLEEIKDVNTTTNPAHVAPTSFLEELTAAFRNMLRREAAGEKTELEKLIKLGTMSPLSVLILVVVPAIVLIVISLFVKGC